ncbi:MAG TPA: hypothetical protein VH142_17340, partial [Polyangiaceae bacterium]|nr:hypothetical protein [Polyangiaceae bacterium]
MTTNPMLKWPMFIIPARWGFQGVVGQERLAIADDPSWIMDLKKPDLTSASDFIFAGHFKCAAAQIASDSLDGAWGFVNYEAAWLPPAVLTAMMLVMLGGVLVLLQGRDPV